MIPAIGSVVASSGIGLDICGAIFLGVSVLKSPVSAASLLFSDPAFAGRKAVSELPVRDTVESMLQGRVGVACLLAGFLLQLAGLALPSASHASLLPIATALLTFSGARYLANRWIRGHRDQLLEEVWRSSRIDVVVENLDAVRKRPRRYPGWKEPLLFRYLGQLVDTS
jgi:hypothetical protein